MKNGLIIGKARLFSMPSREYWIIHCHECDLNFHVENLLKKIQKCPKCKNYLKIINFDTIEREEKKHG